MSEKEMVSEQEKTDRTAVFKEVVRVASARFDAEMKWIDDIERKSSSLLAVNGVVLALTVPLLTILCHLFQRTVKYYFVIVFPDAFMLYSCILLYIVLVIFLGISIYHAYHAYKVERYSVPNVLDIISKVKDDDNFQLVDVYMKEIAELESSLSRMDNVRIKKANNIKKSQLFFLLGVFVLIVLLILCLIYMFV